MIGLEHEAHYCRLIPASSLGSAPFVETPQTRTVPSVGASMQPRIDSSVVLPLPEGPIRSVSLPPASERLSFERLHLPGPDAEHLADSVPR